jgi:hypothetical protein
MATFAERDRRTAGPYAAIVVFPAVDSLSDMALTTRRRALADRGPSSWAASGVVSNSRCEVMLLRLLLVLATGSRGTISEVWR